MCVCMYVCMCMCMCMCMWARRWWLMPASLSSIVGMLFHSVSVSMLAYFSEFMHSSGCSKRSYLALCRPYMGRTLKKKWSMSRLGQVYSSDVEHNNCKHKVFLHVNLLFSIRARCLCTCDCQTGNTSSLRTFLAIFFFSRNSALGLPT